MSESRADGLRDLVALLSALIFVLGAGIGMFLLFFYKLAPSILGPLDQPIDNLLFVIPFFVALVVFFAFGGFCGGALWLIVMSRFLPKRTLYKWLTYGPQIRPVLALNLRLLEALYAKNESAL